MFSCEINNISEKNKGEDSYEKNSKTIQKTNRPDYGDLYVRDGNFCCG